MRNKLIVSSFFMACLLGLVCGCQKSEPEAAPSPEATPAAAALGATGVGASQPGAAPPPANAAEVIKSSEK